MNGSIGMASASSGAAWTRSLFAWRCVLINIAIIVDAKQLEPPMEEASLAASTSVRPPLAPLSRSLPAALIRAREAVMARVRPTLRVHDMTEPQWRVLRTLATLEEIEITRLSELVFLLPSSLSRILRDLGERGLVQRRTSDEDLRRGLISISEAGLALIGEAEPSTALVKAEIERLFGSARMSQLLALLAELEDALGGAQPSE
jgi:homoprotocatechuate degradation regulator HpaR